MPLAQSATTALPTNVMQPLSSILLLLYTHCYSRTITFVGCSLNHMVGGLGHQRKAIHALYKLLPRNAEDVRKGQHWSTQHVEFSMGQTIKLPKQCGKSGLTAAREWDTSKSQLSPPTTSTRIATVTECLIFIQGELIPEKSFI